MPAPVEAVDTERTTHIQNWLTGPALICPCGHCCTCHQVPLDSETNLDRCFTSVCLCGKSWLIQELPEEV